MYFVVRILCTQAGRFPLAWVSERSAVGFPPRLLSTKAGYSVGLTAVAVLGVVPFAAVSSVGSALALTGIVVYEADQLQSGLRGILSETRVESTRSYF